MKRRILVLCAVVLALALVSVSLVSASPQAPGTPTMRWVTTSATTAELRVDGLTNGGTAGNGAVGWDIYFRFPNSVAAPYPTVSITAGPLWTGMSPCNFSTNVTNGAPSGSGGTGDRGTLINGFCTSGIPTNPITGSNILVATVTLSGCPAGSSAFVMDLDSGDDVFGTSVANMVDKNADSYYFSDADLTDGAPMCSPTAVTMTGFGANNENPAAGGVMALWPLLAGGAAVVAGGAYALSRRKR